MLKEVSYEESRLEFFREELAHVKRKLEWAVAHNPNWEDCAEKGEIVSFYQDIVKMLEEGMKNDVG